MLRGIDSELLNLRGFCRDRHEVFAHGLLIPADFSSNHERAALAFVIVSRVVKIFEDAMKRGFRRIKVTDRIRDVRAVNA
jgi:hypothetical protein